MDKNKITSIGQDLVLHSLTADFTKKRGLVKFILPQILEASDRMSAHAISDYLKEKGFSLSATTIAKAIKNNKNNQQKQLL